MLFYYAVVPLYFTFHPDIMAKVQQLIRYEIYSLAYENIHIYEQVNNMCTIQLFKTYKLSLLQNINRFIC